MNFKGRIKIDKHSKTGAIGEKAFMKWYKSCYDYQIFKQPKFRDIKGIDFVDELGYKYDVKTTIKNTYTFNCSMEDLRKKLICDFYPLIQIIGEYAYIEDIVTKDYILDKAKPSYINDSCFIWKRDLMQTKLFFNE